MDVGSGSGTKRKSTSPKKTCDLSTQKFAAIIDLAAFVDKTLFIKAFLQEDNSKIVILAPRRFGKSTNMDMVREFVSGNEKLFKDNRLKIYEEERHFFIENCKENPVIHVDFKSVGGESGDEVLRSIKRVIQCAYDDHKYLVKEVGEKYTWADEKLERVFCTVEKFVMFWKKPENVSRIEVIYGLKWLSEILHKYYSKLVYVFIDEYDAPIINAIVKTNPGDAVVDETIHLINDMMCNFLKGNDHVKRALINARVRTDQGPANNIIHYEFLKSPRFGPYFGFTDSEVKGLFERDEFVTLKHDEIRKWYNGYNLLHTNQYAIYSSYSILQYLDKSREMNKPLLKCYWVDSEDITNMKELFAIAEIRERIEELVNDEDVKIMPIQKMTKYEIIDLKSLVQLKRISTGCVGLFLKFLSDNGYLNVVKYTDAYSWSTLTVPNEEIKILLKEICYNALFFQDKYQLCALKIRGYVEELSLLLQERDRNAFIRFAKAVSDLFDGALMPNNGHELHSVLFTLAYNFRLYEIQTELSVQRIKRRWSGLDILVVLGDVGMIIELKDESSEIAHSRILTENNVTAFDDYRNVTVKILLGLHMKQNREVSLTYTVDDSVKQTVTSDARG